MCQKNLKKAGVTQDRMGGNEGGSTNFDSKVKNYLFQKIILWPGKVIRTIFTDDRHFK